MTSMARLNDIITVPSDGPAEVKVFRNVLSPECPRAMWSLNGWM